MARRVRATPKVNAVSPLQQAADIFALRNRGRSWEQIAIALSITPQEAKNTWNDTLANNVVSNLADYVNAELAHLYELTEAVMPHVIGGSPDHYKIALQIVETRMKLLGAAVVSSGAQMPSGGSGGAQEGHKGTVIELTAGGGEDSYVDALQKAHETVQQQRPA